LGKRLLHTFFAIIVIFSLGSCGKSVEEDGTCSTSFMSDYMKVREKVKISRSTPATHANTENHRRAANACDNLFSSHKDVSCQGKIGKKISVLSTEDLKAECDDIKRRYEQTKN
jgi:hypothetical protein